MRLFDFQCDTCDFKFEQMIEGNESAVPCKRVACGGQAVRLLGGKVGFGRGGEDRHAAIISRAAVGDYVPMPLGGLGKVVHRGKFQHEGNQHEVILAVPVKQEKE